MSSTTVPFVPRILLDARKLGDGGIGIYIENLIEGLLDLASNGGPRCELSLLVTSDGALNFDSRWGGKVRFIEDNTPRYSPQEYCAPLVNRSVFRSHQLFHAPHYTLPYFLPIPSVVTIHDAIHISAPEGRLHRPVGRMLIGSALRRATRVITVSVASARELKGLFPRAAGKALTVVPNALRKGLEPIGAERLTAGLFRRGLPGGYLLFVGTGRPHKGFRDALKTLALLRSEGAESFSQLKLVAVGSRFESYYDHIDASGLAGAVDFMGECDVAELNVLYRGASAVIVPSLIEGFGLVALEAMACGTPVICSHTRSLREVADECAWYGQSPEDYANAFRSIVEDDSARRQRVMRGLMRASSFSREQAALRTLGVYADILGFPLPGYDSAGELVPQVGATAWTAVQAQARLASQ